MLTGLFSSYDQARVHAYQGRPGNPNRIEIKYYGETLCTKFPEVGYFNCLHSFCEDSLEHFDEIKRFYFEDGLKFKVLVPQIEEYGPEKLNHFVESEGGMLKEKIGVLHANLDGLSPPAVSGSQYTVEDVTAHTIREFVETYILGFGADINNFEAIFENMELLLDIPDLYLTLLRLGPEPIGVGVLYLKGDRAYLAGGATKEAYRESGAHVFSIRSRIERARALGASTLSSWATLGQDSYNNMLSQGLEHICTANLYLLGKSQAV